MWEEWTAQCAQCAPSKCHRPLQTIYQKSNCSSFLSEVEEHHRDTSLKHPLLIHPIFLESIIFSQGQSQIFLWHHRLYPHHLRRSCMWPKSMQSGLFSGMLTFSWNVWLCPVTDEETLSAACQECKPFLFTTSLEKHLRSMNKLEALACLGPSGKTSNAPAHFNDV